MEAADNKDYLKILENVVDDSNDNKMDII